jgi:hypothetical protein
LFQKYSYFFIKNIKNYLKLKWNAKFWVLYNKIK